jgi:hypothetical protein
LITGHGAHHVPVNVLSDTAARALLVDRIGAERCAAEPAAVTELVAGCGGFPLALSIIAGRTQAHSHLALATLAAELRDAGLGAFDEDDPAASLPTVMSWSYQALTGQQARAFGLLGIAPGPQISLLASASLTGLPIAETRSLLRGLERASLIEEDNSGRYRMHDLIRRYATDRAGDQTETDRAVAIRRLVDFYLHTACASARLLNPHRPPIQLEQPAPGCHPHTPPDYGAAMAWFDTERACLLAAQRAASAQGWHETVWQMAWALHAYLSWRVDTHDHVVSWQTALAAADQLAPMPKPLATGTSATLTAWPVDTARHGNTFTGPSPWQSTPTTATSRLTPTTLSSRPGSSRATLSEPCTTPPPPCASAKPWTCRSRKPRHSTRSAGVPPG